MARLIEHLATAQLIVLLLEDVHWADEMSLRLLAFITRRIASWRVLLVVTSRDEELADAPSARRIIEELCREPNVTRGNLGPLTRHDTIELVRALAHASNRLGALEEQVWTLSEGNPFVAVETTRAALEGAAPPGSGNLPQSRRVREMIAARLDRLGANARLIAAVAAVLGRDCEFRLLHRTSGLDEAAAAVGIEELIRRRVLHGVGERFDFTHHRLQAVVYEQIFAPRRRLLHRRVGEALEALPPGDPARDPLALGLHFREAEDWAKAMLYLRTAGVDAMTRSAYREAVICLEQALALSGRLPETPEGLEQAIDLHLDLRASLHAMGELDGGFAHLREAEHFARRLNDQRRLGFTSVYLTHYHWLKKRLPEARAAGQEAFAIGEALRDSCLTVSASFYLGVICATTGDYREAEAFYRQSLTALSGDSRERCGLMGYAEVMVRARFAETLAERGDFARGLGHAYQALRVAEELDHPYSLAMAYRGLGFSCYLKGDLDQAAGVLQRGLTLAEEWNLPVWLTALSAPLGHVYALMGRSSEAISILRSTAARNASMYGISEPRFMITLGDALARAGELDEALSLTLQALELARSRGQPGVEGWGLRLLADIAAHRDPPRVAESAESYREAFGRARARNAAARRMLPSRPGRTPQADR